MVAVGRKHIMMRIRKNLIATLILLMLLLSMEPAHSFQKTKEEVPTVSYCDLIHNPEKYDKKTIRLKALYIRGFEVSALEDPECKSDKSIWVEFDSASRQCTKAEIQKAYDKVFYPPRKKKKGMIEMPGPERAELRVVGQFNGPKPGIPIGSEGKRILTGYGHLNGFNYQFIIHCIEGVKPVPWK
jgi:hypothetical protein